jgi:hypothetical protein
MSQGSGKDARFFGIGLDIPESAPGRASSGQIRTGDLTAEKLS